MQTTSLPAGEQVSSLDFSRIAQDLQIRKLQVEAVAQLLDEGNTVPFITRYRKERTGGLDEEQIRRIQVRVGQQRQLSERKETILKSIDTQGKLTDELRQAILAADSPKRLEDLYLPFKPKKRSLATEAREKGFEPLAIAIWTRDPAVDNLTEVVHGMVDPEKQWNSPEDILTGAQHILAETIAEIAEIRGRARTVYWDTGEVQSVKNDNVPDNRGKVFREYFDFKEAVKLIPPHRILAINRGERENILRVKIAYDHPRVVQTTLEALEIADHPHRAFLEHVLEDALTRLVIPSLEREARRELTERAQEHAVGIFAQNLKNLLLQPPMHDKRVLAIDPGLRNGCKLAALDEQGNLLEEAIVYPHARGDKDRLKAKYVIDRLIRKHQLTVIAIGNGTACRETEELIAEMISEIDRRKLGEFPPYPPPPPPQARQPRAPKTPKGAGAPEPTTLAVEAPPASEATPAEAAASDPETTTPASQEQTAASTDEGTTTVTPDSAASTETASTETASTETASTETASTEASSEAIPTTGEATPVPAASAPPAPETTGAADTSKPNEALPAEAASQPSPETTAEGSSGGESIPPTEDASLTEARSEPAETAGVATPATDAPAETASAAEASTPAVEATADTTVPAAVPPAPEATSEITTEAEANRETTTNQTSDQTTTPPSDHPPAELIAPITTDSTAESTFVAQASEMLVTSISSEVPATEAPATTEASVAPNETPSNEVSVTSAEAALSEAPSLPEASATPTEASVNPSETPPSEAIAAPSESADSETTSPEAASTETATTPTPETPSEPKAAPEAEAEMSPPPPPPEPEEQLPETPDELAYCIVNEAGASDYSTSPIAKEELGKQDPLTRGTISIGRRLQDPLAELVKIDPQHVGVGLYQHDMRSKSMKESLEQVIESCVNHVGVDLNTASVPLLRHVSGLNQLVARQLVDYRSQHGAFSSREQLMQVSGFGPARFTQAAGFLKIRDGENPLDTTWIHPESYSVAEKVLNELGFTLADLRDRERVAALRDQLNHANLPEMASQLGVGEPTLDDIFASLARPGRDPREDLPAPIFKRGILRLEDLQPEMELKGTVLNVVDFGAFVDIGVKESGLVHISQLANRFVKSPYEVVRVGDVVRVWVLSVDAERGHVSLTMIEPGTERKPERRPPRGREGGEQEGDRPPRGREGGFRGGPRGPREGSGGGHREGGGRPSRGERRPYPAGEGGPGERGPSRPQRTLPPRKPKPLPKLSQEQLKGKSSLHTFGELEAFFKSRGDSDEPSKGSGKPAAEGTDDKTATPPNIEAANPDPTSPDATSLDATTIEENTHLTPLVEQPPTPPSTDAVEPPAASPESDATVALAETTVPPEPAAESTATPHESEGVHPPESAEASPTPSESEATAAPAESAEETSKRDTEPSANGDNHTPNPVAEHETQAEKTE